MTCNFTHLFVNQVAARWSVLRNWGFSGMTFRFFDRSIGLFGNWATLTLCATFFLGPFVWHGARLSWQRQARAKHHQLANEPEASELWEILGEEIAGEPFVMVSWPGCTTADPRFELLTKKLESELASATEEESSDAALTEEQRARRLADRLGLLATGTYHENWGGRGEKWLQGDLGVWYFITPDGEFYRWDGNAGVRGFLVSTLGRLLGRQPVSGDLLARVGSSPSNQPSPYHTDPRKLSAHCFRTVCTGPQVLQQLLAEDSWRSRELGGIREEDKPRIARLEAYEQLTGLLFGPAAPAGFRWTPGEFRAALPEATRRQLPHDWQWQFAAFVDGIVEREFDGNRNRLVTAPAFEQSRHWDALFHQLRVEPPPRQTCLLLTLSDVGQRNVRRVIGYPHWGMPATKLIDLAINECSIHHAELKLVGIPVSLAAVESEYSFARLWLVGLSGAIGLSIAWLCFGSLRAASVLLFVGGWAALVSLALVDWFGRFIEWQPWPDVEAWALSLPTLVLLFALFHAVQLVHYYRETVSEAGFTGAAERAVRRGWGPCALAALISALALLSLGLASDQTPIRAYGVWAALGVVATLPLVLAFWPSILTTWGSDFARVESKAGDEASGGGWLDQLGQNLGGWVTRRHWLATATCLVLLAAASWGWLRREASVGRPPLFDHDSRIIADQRWLATNFARLADSASRAHMDVGAAHRATDNLALTLPMVLGVVAAVLMLWLRDWQAPFSFALALNPAAGIASLIPLAFPMLVVSGVLGHIGLTIDVGAMMCGGASLAVAASHMMHFLQCFRRGLRAGLGRSEAAQQACQRTATALTQTTLVTGSALAAFACSDFLPTQRFGYLLMGLLAAGWVSGLILFPALLAGPVGRVFELAETRPGDESGWSDSSQPSISATPAPRFETKHSVLRRRGELAIRNDTEHSWPRH